MSTGIQLKARIVKGVGIRRAWRIAELITKATPNPGHTLYQERRNFLRQSSALLVTIPLLRSPALVRTLFSTGPGGMAYQDYRDSDFGFTLQYPTSWKIDVKHRQLYPWKDDEAILKRVIFSGTPALVYLDVWSSRGKTLHDWLGWYKTSREVTDMPIDSNATVASMPAMIFLQNQQRDLLITYFSDEKYVYRLMNWATGEKAHVDAYWHMLESYTPPDVSGKVVTVLPQSMIQETNLWATSKAVRIANCCSYYDRGNPFPCCTNQGNCTWWCYYEYGYVPFTGNAETWWGQVPDYPEWNRSTSGPSCLASIACWSGSPGHVAYAAYWSGTGNVGISEMSWCTDCGSSRSISPSNPSQGWIFKGSGPCPGGVQV